MRGTVRSESRLDLVPKALAVAGLGLLALVAALFDSSSAELTLPGISSPFDQMAMPSVRTTIDLPIWAQPADPTPTARAMHLPASELIVTNAVLASIHEAEVAAGPEIAVASIVPAVSVGRVDLAAPPCLSRPAQCGLLDVQDDSESAVPDVEARPLLAMNPTVTADRADDGFLSGAWRRTSSSVSSVGNSLGKASSSVAGAVRVVSGAVRRVF